MKAAIVIRDNTPASDDLAHFVLDFGKGRIPSFGEHIVIEDITIKIIGISHLFMRRQGQLPHPYPEYSLITNLVGTKSQDPRSLPLQDILLHSLKECPEVSDLDVI